MQGTPEPAHDRFLTTEDLTQRWHTTKSAIHTMRHRGHGPKAIRIGKRNLYRLRDVEQFESEREETRQ
jgi:predicted DNA-binding transcriptional regulator AlpA